MIKDDEYLEGFVDRKDLDVYYATVGNIGKVDGMSKEQISKKHNEIQHMKEVWKKAKEVQELKIKLQKKQNLNV